MITQIPTQKPNTPLLDNIHLPSDLRQLDESQLIRVAAELRSFLLYCVGQTGGHFGAGLGVIELTIALHYLLNTPSDHLIWDVGHQCYPHKILTGRREQMLSMRQQGGLAPFPKRDESAYDCFGTGHSSTSISAALGMAVADTLQGNHRHSVAVIGDGAMTAGMAFEALNHAAHTQANLLVILNDNDMSISPNEGGLATYLAKNLKLKARRSETTAALFEALAFEYQGPVDGNDLDALLPVLKTALGKSGPQFLHITTQKGKGFQPAESDPVGYHAITKLEPINKVSKPKQPTFANIFGRWILATAQKDQHLVGITPAMKEGSDMVAFAKTYPQRFFDVAIAEQHAMTFAAGLACNGMRPVVAIYSTFLQRAYDQLIHDVAIQNLDLLIAIDRAGLVGEDGATHAGCFDIAALRCLPNLIIMTPSDEQEQWLMLNTGYHYKGTAAVRYPRGSGSCLHPITTDEQIPIGKAKLIRSGNSGTALLNFGPLLSHVADLAKERDYTLIDMRFVKPLDTALLSILMETHQQFITLEDHAAQGGAGSTVAEWAAQTTWAGRLKIIGIPDLWVEHASRSEQIAQQIINQL
ncbi:1-deoxy-D-xylulose-5-phosphate synthase [Neptunomonas concharum]|uniref:1-deoxy-D-xylulose-5-phosphate synthase n=1 Tax=Neptunomonas concharum TaxID=1031538 RepID=A0A5P1R8E6_9GAMM|nr:1-deoxy-D-xylulose-5-phosphate synthase [Neptunomonas concharum]QEQ95562.1 1-deoxy-D-xylulose-5-phosphate synthase [Neptunomonas concharum]